MNEKISPFLWLRKAEDKNLIEKEIESIYTVTCGRLS